MLSIYLLVSGFSLFTKETPVHVFIKDEIIRQSSAMLGRKVYVGRAYGGLLNSVTLEDIRVPGDGLANSRDIIRIKKAVVKYNLMKAAFARDVIPSIYRIDISGPEVLLERDKNGIWNLARLAAGEKGGGAPPVFRSRIQINNGTLDYLDSLGYGQPLAKPFRQVFTEVSAYFDLRKKDVIAFNASGVSGKAQARAQGKVNLAFKQKGLGETVKAQVKVKAAKLPLRDWILLIGIPGLISLDLDGFADVDLSTSTPPSAFVQGEVRIAGGKIYGREFGGGIKVDLKDGRTKLDLDRAVFCGGRIRGGAVFDLNRKGIALKSDIRTYGTDLSMLAAGASGRATAAISMEGIMTDLGIQANFDLAGADFDGIRPEKISLSGRLKEDSLAVDYFAASNKKSKVELTGLLRNVSGAGFILEPFASIDLSGQMELSGEKIFGQSIRSARGSFAVEKGSLFLNQISVISGASDLTVSGKFGPGRETDIALHSRAFDMEDLSFLKRHLPKDLGAVTGRGSLEARISGMSPKSFGRDFFKNIEAYSGFAVFRAEKIGLARQEIESASAAISLERGRIKINSTQVRTRNSSVSFEGEADRRGLDLSAKGVLELADLRPITQKYARILGRISFSARAKGPLQKPHLSSAFIADRPSYNDIKIDRLSGNVFYEGGRFGTEKDLELAQSGETYQISAFADLSGPDPEFKGRLYTTRGGLGSAVSMADMAYVELIERKGLAADNPTVRIRRERLELPKLFNYRTQEGFKLYSDKNSYLAAWAASVKGAEVSGKDAGYLLGQAQGALGADITFELKGGRARAAAGVKVSEGRIGSYGFDGIELSVSFDGDRITLHMLLLEKGRGSLSASGKADILGETDISASINKLELSGIETVIGAGFPIEGSLSGSLKAYGKTSYPLAAAELSLSDAGFGGLALKEALGSFAISKDLLEIKSLEIGSGKQATMIKGSLPFNRKSDIDLKVKLSGESTGLIASFIKGASWGGGSGSVEVSVSGKISYPRVNGRIVLDDAVINMDGIRSTLYGLDAELTADNNLFKVKKFLGIIQGDITKGEASPFSFAGSADLRNTFKGAPHADVALVMADSDVNFTLPGLYSGGIKIEGAGLKGRVYFARGEAYKNKALLKGRVLLHDGSLFLPGGSSQDQPSFSPIGLQLVLGMAKNVSILQGQDDRLISTEMTKLNAQIEADGLIVKGDIFSPVIEGDVRIKSGSLNILGRDFEVLSKLDQEKYFASNPGMVQDNTAAFLGTENYGAVPVINATALSEVYEVKEDTASYLSGTSAPKTSKQKVYIITRVSGMPGVIERGKALSINFYPFIEDTTKAPAQFTAAPYDENRVRIMLLPDFVKDTLGFSKGTGAEFDANAVLVNYINTRLDTMISKTVSSRIERALGLESFTVSYNFGRDLERLLPTRGGGMAYAEKPQLGIGFAKNLFDRFYIQMRYSQTIQQIDVLNPTSLNYQLTYKLSPFWALVYYREPMTFQEQRSDYYKAVIQALYRL